MNLQDTQHANPLDVLIAEYLEAEASDLPIDRGQLLRQNPGLASNLRQFFNNHDQIALAARSDPASHAGTDGDSPDTQPTIPPSNLDAALARTEIAASETASTEQSFRIVRYHARGGLGQVSVAIDEQLNREVAFKELQPDIASDQNCQSRFVVEAEITGRLEHPGIVPVYGVGRFSDGRPYYAMRFIRGETLKETIDLYHQASQKRGGDATEGMEFRRLLRRFIDVCHTMHYAHSRGVLHRDLKPGNIMLGKYGETLIVDWGLAKWGTRSPETHREPKTEATLRPSSGSGSAPTRLGYAIGTPAFMSPEQAAGHHDQLTARSDVYGLGATLYYLLAGCSPFVDTDVKTTLKKVRLGDFRRPRAVHPSIPRPLEAICLKAMQTGPDDRYTTSGDIATEIERWLADEPVQAYREPMAERLSRWSRRHRTWMRAIGVAMILIAVVSSVAAIMTNSARRQAELSKQKSLNDFKLARDAVNTWLTGPLEDLRLYPGVEPFLKRILVQATEDYEELARNHSDDPDVELERGRTYLRLGDLYERLDENESAEKAFLAAEHVFNELIELQPHRLAAKQELANSQTQRGLVLDKLGSHEQAEQLYGTAIRGLEPLVRQHPDDGSLRASLGTSQMLLGTLIQSERTVDAERLLQKATNQFETAFLDSPSTTRYQQGLSMSRQVLGGLLLKLGRLEEAEALCVRAIAATSGLADETAPSPEIFEARAGARIYLASVFRAGGRWNRELQTYDDAIRDYQLLNEALPNVPRHRDSLALTRVDRGQLLLQLGKTRSAEDELKLARESYLQLASDDPEVPRYHEGLAACLDNLGQVYTDLDQPDDATNCFEQAIQTLSQLVTMFQIEEYHERLAIAHGHYAQLLRAQESAEAEAYLRQSAEKLENLSTLRPEVPRYRDAAATAYFHLGTLLRETDAAQSKIAYRRAVEIWEPYLHEVSAPQSLQNAAWFFVVADDPDFRDAPKAVSLARRAVADAPQNAEYHTLLGAALYRAGQWQQSVETLNAAIRLRGGEGQARDQFFLATALWQQDQRKQADERFTAAKAWMDEHRPGNLDLAQIRDEAAQLLERE